jgi:DNA-binding NarL/FixJ family response regulator
VKRLEKKELRALLESIKERYPNCDVETFTQRLASRLSKIVLTEFTSSNRRPPHRRPNAHAIGLHHAYSYKRIFRQHARITSLDSSVKAATLRKRRPTKINRQSPAFCSLSPRESQVLHWVSQGKTNKDIGVILEVSPRTVQKHLEHIYQKMGVETRTGAAAKAYEIASNVSK